MLCWAAAVESLGRHGRLRRAHREHGDLPSQACLISAHRKQTFERGRSADAILGVCPRILRCVRVVFGLFLRLSSWVNWYVKETV